MKALRSLAHLLARISARALRGDNAGGQVTLKGVRLAITGPAALQLVRMAMGSWVTQAIYAAAKMRIADTLAAGPKSCDEIAAATHASADAVVRLLRALGSLGIVIAGEDGRFALTAVGRSLETGRDGSVRAMVLTLGEIHYDAWGSLVHSVKTGTAAFPSVFGASLFDHLNRSPHAGETFHRAMDELSALISQSVLAAYDFSGIDLLADVGGGYGRFLTTILQSYPGMRGVLMDTPAVIAAADKHLEFHPCRGRCTLLPGNLLEAVPRGAGGYLMSGVLHDWDDADAVKILDNCRRAMTPAGRIVVVETLRSTGFDTAFGALLDLNMLVMTGGRERTEQDFRRLFAAAGLTVTRIVRTLAPQCVIEGTRNGSAARGI